MPAQIAGRKGYQVVAKSQGVTKEEVAFLESYGIPIALNPEVFTEGRRLFRLPSGRLGFNYLKNMGVGYDGRFGAIYSRTIIMDENQFLRFGADPRIFEPLFTQNPKEPGNLAQLELKSSQMGGIDFEVLRETLHGEDTLWRILGAVFEDRKVILLDPAKEDLKDFMVNLLLLLPDQMRVIPYTTYCVEPDREPQFTFLVVPAGERHRMPQAGQWEVINLGSKNQIRTGDSPLCDPARSLSEMTFAGNFAAIQDFHSKFSSYPHTPRLMPRLEYWCLQTKLEKAESAEEAIDITITLAEKGLTHELSEHYYSEAVGRAQRLLNPAKISQVYTSELRASNKDEDLVSAYENGLNSLLMWPDEAANFCISALTVGTGRGREEILSKILALSSGGHEKTRVLLSMLKNPTFRNEWLQRAKSSGEFRIIARMIQELSVEGDDPEAIDLVHGAFSGARLPNKPSVQNALVMAIVNSPEAAKLPPKLRIEMDSAVIAQVKEDLRKSRSETRNLSFDVIDVIALLGMAAGVFALSSIVYFSGAHLLGYAFFLGSALGLVYVLQDLARHRQVRRHKFIWNPAVGDGESFAKSLTENIIDPTLNSLREIKGKTTNNDEIVRIEKLSTELNALKISVQGTAKESD